jgi:type VI protein secretion system component Hcp
MARRQRIRKLREELDELEQLQRPQAEQADEGPEEKKEKAPVAALQQEDPVTRTLELQKAAGNKAVGASLARWPFLAAPQAPVGEWPKQLEMIIDGTTVIPLESAQISSSRHMTDPTGTGVSREKPIDETGEMVVTLKVGKWSSDLFRESLYGHGFKTVEIVFPGKDGKGIRIILEDVLISNYSVSGHGGADHDAPMESLSLNFKKRTFDQTPPPKR